MKIKDFLPAPILIEVKDSDILVKEIGGNKFEGSFEFYYIKRPSGKIIEVKASNTKLAHKSFHFSKDMHSQDLHLLKKLVARAGSTKFALTKKTLIWNFFKEPTKETLEQVHRLSLLADAREILIISEAKSLENEEFNQNTPLDYNFIGQQNVITSAHKSLITLILVIIVAFGLLVWRINLPS
jgi:hypothetical protein